MSDENISKRKLEVPNKIDMEIAIDNDTSVGEGLLDESIYLNNGDKVHCYSLDIPCNNVKTVPGLTNITKKGETSEQGSVSWRNKTSCVDSREEKQKSIDNFIKVEKNVGRQSCTKTDQNEEMIKNILKQVSQQLNQMHQDTLTESSNSQTLKTLPQVNSPCSEKSHCVLTSHTHLSKPGSASNLFDLAKKFNLKENRGRRSSCISTVPSCSPSVIDGSSQCAKSIKRTLMLEPTDLDKPSISKLLNSLKTTVDNPELHRLHSDAQSFMCSVESVLPHIPVHEARRRCYMVGRVGSHGSLLGLSELLRYFPDQKISVFVGTWNMNSQLPPKNLDDFLLPLGVNHLPDIYAVGVQEGVQDRREWEITLQTTLGPSHVLFHSVGLGVLYLAVFLRRDLIWFCSDPEDAAYSTRPGSVVKTKGAVAISFMFFGTSLLFINSHLTAHEKKLKERLSDYEKICVMLDLPKNLQLKPQCQSKDVTARFDNVFWCGDLNFRLTQKRDVIIKLLENRKIQNVLSCEMMLKHDQLQKAMKEGVAFRDFHEATITFVPSYKYNTGSSLFDSKKLRVPSYTDRVLFRHKKKGTVNCLLYDIAENINASDHKPVYALFEVCVKPGRDNIPLAAGLFNRDVYLEASRRRSAALESQDQKSYVCSVM
ncbi:inositol polyphosphate 5-phosphatase E-like isoform X2 [Tachypleus tridentatus]|uniref:inositol polyphosphate 5-phosphatase E-like isoform X2 n=1 Tax=Tachypleus tridentatus TaxID=6853 RepID=UPI003FD0C969